MNPTPKEKAKEIVEKFKPHSHSGYDLRYGGYDEMTCISNAKQCALIAVDEIDNVYQKLTPKDNPYFYLFELEYWQEVKQEIIKI